MRIHYGIALVSILSATLTILSGCSGKAQNRTLYYAEYSGSDNIDWDEEIPVFHYWEQEDSEASDSLVSSWKAACEEAFRPEPTARRYVQGYYNSMNQFVTVHDFVELWYREAKYRENDAFIFWRLDQYLDLECRQCNALESSLVVKKAIESLVDYEPMHQWDLNFQASLRRDLKEFYERMLFKQSLCGSAELCEALRHEEEAWRDYHKKMMVAYGLLESAADGNNGTLWPMELAGIAEENLDMRIASLENYLRIEEDSFRFPEEDAAVGIDMVMRESDGLISELEEDDYHHPLQSRKDALNDEVAAWLHWVDSRTSVSHLLNGRKSEEFDSVTSNIIRRKYVMLKNRYKPLPEPS